MIARSILKSSLIIVFSDRLSIFKLKLKIEFKVLLPVQLIRSDVVMVFFSMVDGSLEVNEFEINVDVEIEVLVVLVVNVILMVDFVEVVVIVVLAVMQFVYVGLGGNVEGQRGSVSSFQPVWQQEVVFKILFIINLAYLKTN